MIVQTITRMILKYVQSALSTRQRTDANEGEPNQANANGIGAVMSQRQSNNNS